MKYQNTEAAMFIFPAKWEESQWEIMTILHTTGRTPHFPLISVDPSYQIARTRRPSTPELASDAVIRQQ
jgi:hypothetical protein